MSDIRTDPAAQGTADSKFLWGVATSAFQSEGGYDGPGQPRTNWYMAQETGRVMPVGRAADFWTRYREDMDLCQGLGLNAFRLSVEWSRIQPGTAPHRGPPPPFDLAAINHYADMIADCRTHGMEPIVTLHHFTHPDWLDSDVWLDENILELFGTYVRETVLHLNRRLVDHHQQLPLRMYVTINEPNTLAVNSYFTGQFPTQAPSTTQNLRRATDLLLAAHIRAYNLIHDLHEMENWPRPSVTTNLYCSDLYWTDKMLLDLLMLRERHIGEHEAIDYLGAKAREFESEYIKATIPLRQDLPYRIGDLFRTYFRKRGYHFFTAKHFGYLFHELERSKRSRVFDFIGMDYYDPFTAHFFRLPWFGDLELKNRSLRAWLGSSITSKWWDWRLLPDGLRFFCRYYTQDFDRPLIILENGMALRKTLKNRHSPRRDRVYRSVFLREHIDAVIRMVADGLPVHGYMYWSLFDNYEWGTYTPRFGLYGLDFEQGTDRMVEDHLGDRPAETYAELIREANKAWSQKKE